jgi:hypothetical protein
LTKIAYELPLWPDLVFYFHGMPRLPLFHDFGFARPPDTAPVTVQSPADLQPWACLRDEVIEGFGPPVREGDIWPPYESYKFQARPVGGRCREFWTIFSWKLLQQVEWG